MPALGMAPPPAQDVSSQMTPMAMASQRPSGAPSPMPGGQAQPPQGASNPVVAQVYTALIHLQQAMQQEPDLATYFNPAIKQIQIGLGQVLGQQQQQGVTGGSGSLSSATPPNEPGVGMPI